jgi:hypothetical protein
VALPPGRALLLSVFVLACALVGTAVAGQTIETDSFSLTLPDHWIPDLTTKPVSAKGPRGELLHVSSTVIQGSGPANETERLRRELEAAVVRAMQRTASDPSMITVKPLAATTLPSGATLHEAVSRTRDGKSLVAQFALMGPPSVVLVTLDTPAASATASIAAIRAAVSAIRWGR